MDPSAWVEVMTPPNPAAGAGFSRTIPGHTWEKNLAIECALTTSAVVANRLIFLAYTNGDGLEICRSVAPAVVTASLTVVISWNMNADSNSQIAAGSLNAPIPPDDLPSGYHLLISVAAMDPGDQISNIRMTVRRTPTGPMEYAAGAHEFDPGTYR